MNIFKNIYYLFFIKHDKEYEDKLRIKEEEIKKRRKNRESFGIIQTFRISAVNKHGKMVPSKKMFDNIDLDFDKKLEKKEEKGEDKKEDNKKEEKSKVKITYDLDGEEII